MADETIILVPGLLSDGVVWRAVDLALGGRGVVADLSTRDDLTRMAEDLLAANPGPLAVAGHSMGARVAMEMARLAPDRIRRLALLDTGIHPLRDGETEKREAITRFAHEHGMQALAERWLPPMVAERNQADAELMGTLTAMVLRMDADLHARQIRALTRRPDASAYLHRINCPALLVVGREDAWSPVAQHQEMARLLPHARLEIVDGAGHFAPVERPDAVARLVAPFLLGQD